MFFYDWTIIILIPAILFTIYAQGKVNSAFNRYLKVSTRSGLTGGEAARKILNMNGLYDIPVELAPGKLSDHYDPSKRVLRLSRDVYYGSSIASVGVAAHESGHAIQHDKHYAPLILRTTLVPIANIGSNLSWILIMLGFVIRLSGLINIGILLFSAAVLFQIITLPVEFNASNRAITQIENGNLLTYDEVPGAKKVLKAAALTYVAATLTAVLQLVRLLVITRDSRD